MSSHRVQVQVALLLALVLGTCPSDAVRAEPPLVVFDVPFSIECRDVTPKDRGAAYPRKIIEAVIKISPQLLAGEERDLKRLHYEISTEQQMPVVGFLPSSEVATDVAGGTIAIQASDYRGNLNFRYLILPNTGNGELKGDLESSHAQYALLAPKQLLLAAGTTQRGYGVFYELRTSKQDTLQKQREFASLFEVHKAWRADYVTVRCKARGAKRGLGGLGESEVDCGSTLLCVGLYRMDDDEARAYAGEFARKQQRYFDRLALDAKNDRGKSKSAWSDSLLSSVGRMFADHAAKAKLTNTKLGASVEAQLDENKGMREELPPDARGASQDLDTAKQSLRKMNGK